MSVKDVKTVHISFERHFSIGKEKMSVQKKNSNTKSKQFEIMVDFMVQHPELAKGHINSPEAKSKSRHLWERLTLELNSACLPTRDTNGWKKVWADYKNHIKVKCKRNKNGFSGTGGGPSNYCPLTPQEQQVYELLSLNVSIHGMSGSKDFGAATISKEPTSSSAVFDEEDLENNIENMDESIILTQEQCTENLNTPSRTNRKRSASNTDSLLNKQVENQISFQENTLKCLMQINENQKNNNKLLTSIKDNISDIRRYSKRKCEIEERSLQLQIEKYEFKKKIEIEKSKRKLAQLELKQKMFQLESSKYNVSSRSPTSSPE